MNSLLIPCLLWAFGRVTALGDQVLLNSQRLGISAALIPKLSNGAAVYLPDDQNWGNVTHRFQNLDAPSYSVVVEVATEKDIQITVRFANKHSIPFLAIGGAHGTTFTLGRLKKGIGISMRRMKALEMSDDGRTARLGPGLTAGEVIRKLAAVNKRTTTGSCMCTGLTGVMLGGGHGLLQGQHGLLADQLVEARLVLDNGEVITVSKSSHADLYWALRGAGHNFGILSSVKYKIYPKKPSESWSLVELYFTQDKLEAVVKAVNDITDNGKSLPPRKLVMMNRIIKVPTIDPSNAIVYIPVAYQGGLAEAEKIASPFRELEPIFAETLTTDYIGLKEKMGFSESSPPCRPGGFRTNLIPVSVNVYNVTALRKAYKALNDLLKTHTNFRDSMLLLENYGLHAVRAVPDESTAVADRQLNILIGISLTSESDEPKYVKAIHDTGVQIRKILREGSGSRDHVAYVNYAYGDETLLERYGPSWRLQKLKELKRKYDPHGKFNFYNPIV